ncbi:MAG: LysR family transcriptional regulator [Deltaproteobacteria bacterium]|nr:LysR family transcriptional regulator [Deltaproteobacteria bacterium]
MDLDLLRAFAVFARLRNFTLAARALHCSQPALHGQVRRLQEHLGVPLYRRRGRHLELTAEGVRVAGFAHEMEDRARRFVAELRGEEGTPSVALCAGEGAFAHLLGDGLRAFLARGTALLQLLTRDRDGALEAVRSGEAGLGVAPLDQAPSDLHSEVLAVVPQVLAVPEGHALAGAGPVSVRALAHQRLVVPHAGRPQREALERALSGVPWQPAVEAHGWDLMLRFVALGVGVAVVNGFCAAPSGVCLRPVRELAPLRYRLFWRRTDHAVPGLVALAEDLRRATTRWRQGE